MAIRNIVTGITLTKPFNISNLNQEVPAVVEYALCDTSKGKRISNLKKTKANIIINKNFKLTKTDTMRLNIPAAEGGVNDVLIKWKNGSVKPQYIKTYIDTSDKNISNVSDKNGLKLFKRARDKSPEKAIEDYIKKVCSKG